MRRTHTLDLGECLTRAVGIRFVMEKARFFQPRKLLFTVSTCSVVHRWFRTCHLQRRVNLGLLRLLRLFRLLRPFRERFRPPYVGAPHNAHSVSPALFLYVHLLQTGSSCSSGHFCGFAKNISVSATAERRENNFIINASGIGPPNVAAAVFIPAITSPMVESLRCHSLA